jgi:predicted PurR-regulated permease PerM
MDIKIDKKTLRSLGLLVLSLIFVYWLLHDISTVKVFLKAGLDILSPFIIGSVLAFIINVPMRAFEGLLKKIPNNMLRRVIALLLTLIAVALVVTLVFVLLIPQLTDTVQSLIPKLQSFVLQVEAWINQFLTEHPEVMEWIVNNTDMEKLDWASLVQKALDVVGNSVTTIFSSAISAIGSVTSGFMTAFIAVAFSIYTLFQKDTLARQGRKILYAFLPERVSDYIVRVLRLSNSTFSNFLSGQCVEVCILGTMFAISMAIFQMPYIPLVSVLVAVTAFIPVVGAWVGCIVGAFLILVANPLQAVWFVVMFLVLQQIENNVIYPRVVGTSIGLSGMWGLVAVALGGEFMGVAGMFLMIPFASVLFTLARELVHSRLEGRQIASEKLDAQPPELRSHFKEHRAKKKEKLELKKLMKQIGKKEDTAKK